jgi:DNA-binding PadR family transcriptional regulator
MTDLTAAQVLALSALGEGRPMTDDELARAVADLGMHLGDYVTETIYSLAAHGMAERTPAVSLGKYRITERGRAELAARTAHFHESYPAGSPT